MIVPFFGDLTPATIKAKVIELADAQPERVAECRYVNTDTHDCECIVGVALCDLGVERHTLVEHNYRRIDSFFVEDADTRWLRRVQDWQDQGTTWGKAVLQATEGNSAFQ